ncbi:pentatricopeptide repeat-containing protein 2, mitochondrial [Callorhinchus milii]|uniref:pentatricopeptide repeat-containing protein 2, mitochondrial n=1 Tax=Callorhinchus milii TaxID=7868 RepID=UPI001C3F7943|nr:pentatricopeptide repeat-containing protein 2, mitochondrial [Callorhinchus milii]
MAAIVTRGGGVLFQNLRSGAFHRHSPKRYLLSDNVIQLLEFQRRKIVVANQIHVSRDQYFKMIEEKLEKDQLILKNDLKVLLHLCQTLADVEIAKKTIYRYHSENRNMAFGEFKFGPLFVRLCYELGLEETVEEIVKDQNLKGFFSDSTSFNIAMDMLFTKGSYESALGVLLEMKNQGIKFNNDTYTLAFAICYKLNTAESFKICTMLLEESLEKGNLIPRHAYCFAVALAINQNDVTKGQSIFSHILNADNKICCNLHILILAMSGAQQELCSVLESAVISYVSPFVKKMEFSQELLGAVRETLENDPKLQNSFEDVYEMLTKSGQITALTLDEMLCQAPNGKKQLNLLLGQRKISRRTFKPLQSALFAE